MGNMNVTIGIRRWINCICTLGISFFFFGLVSEYSQLMRIVLWSFPFADSASTYAFHIVRWRTRELWLGNPNPFHLYRSMLETRILRCYNDVEHGKDDSKLSVTIWLTLWLISLRTWLGNCIISGVPIVLYGLNIDTNQWHCISVLLYGLRWLGFSFPYNLCTLRILMTRILLHTSNMVRTTQNLVWQYLALCWLIRFRT